MSSSPPVVPLFEVFESRHFQQLESFLLPQPMWLDGLAERIATGDGVAVIGAGVSIPSKLPSWPGLMNQLFAQVRTGLDSQEAAWLQTQLDTGNYSLAAEFIDHHYPGVLASHLTRELYSKNLAANPIQLELQRLPFNTIITTNYDNLLENSSRVRPKVSTWRTPGSLVANLVHHKPTLIFKTHGDLADPASLVLGSSKYRQLTHSEGVLRSSLKILLLTKTALFVGLSLKDAHIWGLLDELVAEFGKENINQHYIILPDDEAPPKVADLLARLYPITVFAYTTVSKEHWHQMKQPGGKFADPAFSHLSNSDLRTAGTSAILSRISGKVALRIGVDEVNVNPYRQDFCSYLGCRALLRAALDATGAFRGDLAIRASLINRSDKADSDAPVFWISEGPTDPGIRDKEVKPLSVSGKVHWLCKAEETLNVRNVDTAAKDPGYQQRFGQINYLKGHPDVGSELAAPIDTRGDRYGVLNLESRIRGGFNEDHESVIREFASLAGGFLRVGSALNERANLVRSNTSALTDALKKILDSPAWSQLRNQSQTSGLFYTYDFVTGAIQARAGLNLDPGAEKLVSEGGVSFPHSDDCSLVRRIFSQRRAELIPDPDRGYAAALISNAYRDTLGIHGPVFAAPLHFNRVLIGALVLWHKEKAASHVQVRELYGPFELLSRIFHTLVNSLHDKASVGGLDTLATKISGFLGEVASAGAVSMNETTAEHLLRASGFRRIRFYAKQPGVEAGYLSEINLERASENPDVITKSELLSETEGGPPPTHIEIHAYGSDPDRYLAQLLETYPTRPYALTQQPGVLGDPVNKSDRAAGQIKKLPGRKWFKAPWIEPEPSDLKDGVAFTWPRETANPPGRPAAKRPQLLGYIVADNQIAGSSKAVDDGPAVEDGKHWLDIMTALLAFWGPTP